MTLSTSEPRTSRVAAAKRSPELANLHDEAGWLALYAADAVVEDPVGTPPCQRGVFTRAGKKDDLERFYATFIAPSQIRVEERGDFVHGDKVVRDVVLHVKLPGGAKASVPAILEYDFEQTPSGLKVKHLRAYWDAGKNGREVMASGLPGKLTSILSGFRLARVLGGDWTKRYIAGTKTGVRRQGPPAVEALVKALAAQDARELNTLCTADADFITPGAPPEPLRALGQTISQLAVTRATSCGYTVTARFTAQRGGVGIEGVAFVEFDSSSRLIRRLRLFWDVP